jgi:hypothetical protein
MAAIAPGPSDCSTGFSSRIYSQLIGDTSRNGFQGNAIPGDWHDMVKAICYAAAKGVADELNADSYAPAVAVETFSAPKASDQSTTSTSFADVTGLSFSIVASGVYEYEFVLPVVSADDLHYMPVRLTGPASPTAVYSDYRTLASGGGAAVDTSAVAFSVEMTSAQLGTTVTMASIRGIVRNGTNAGTVQLQFRSDASGFTRTIKAGAFVRYMQIG